MLFTIFFKSLRGKPSSCSFLHLAFSQAVHSPCYKGSVSQMSALLSEQYNVPSTAFPSYMTSAWVTEELQLSPQNLGVFTSKNKPGLQDFEHTHLSEATPACLTRFWVGFLKKPNSLTILSAKPPVLTFDPISHLQSHLLAGQSS